MNRVTAGSASVEPAEYAGSPAAGGATGASRWVTDNESAGPHTRTRREQAEPQWQSGKEDWGTFQDRHCQWRTGGGCTRAPENEGKSPPQTPSQIGTAVIVSIVGGGPLEPRPAPNDAPAAVAAGAPARSPLPMDTSSPPPSRPPSPMDISSPESSRPPSQMDTSSPAADRAGRPAKSGSSLPSQSPSSSVVDVHASNPDLSPQDVPAGMHVNGKGMLEKTTFSKVYRVDPGFHRDAILKNGFGASSRFEGIDKMIPGDAIIVSETQAGAKAFGDGEYGPGHYDIYEIDARGLNGASLQDNVDYNTVFTARQLGRTPQALKQMAPRDVAEGALEFREAHIDAAAGRPGRIHLVERGVPRPQTPDSDSSGNAA